MGKAKSRILHKGRNDQLPTISRSEAVMKVCEYLENNDTHNASLLVTMFGLCAEEVLEAGASYEIVTSMRNIFKQ